jgi:hypothetical protein
MATYTDPGYPTLQNILNRMRPDGSIETDMIDLMSKKMPLLEDMPWKEANGMTGHLITSVNSLPTPQWKELNKGIDATKGNSVQFTEACGMLEDRSDVDVKVAELNGNAAAFRASEDKIKLESFAQTLETAVLYENAMTNAARIHGLSSRYVATTGYTASSYVLKPGTNSGSNCRSIWLINWNEDKCFGIYPKASMGGLKREDMGKRYVRDQNSKDLLVYTTQFNWDVGLAVADYRYSCRFQWDPDDSAGGFADSGKGLYLGLQDMIGTVYDMDQTKARLYMDRTSAKKLAAQLASNSANFLEYIELGKRRVPSFMGVPIRITDSLVAESAIS